MSIKEWREKVDAMTPEERLQSVELTDVGFYQNAIVLRWAGAMGFGEYTLTLDRTPETEEEDAVVHKIIGDSEHMDLRNDKRLFLRHLLNQLADMVDLSEERQCENDWRARNNLPLEG